MYFSFEHFDTSCGNTDLLLIFIESECESGQVHLVGGAVMTKGRVEVCANGTWGRVCHDFWADDDARVVCRQLGYSHKSEFISKRKASGVNLCHTVSEAVRYGTYGIGVGPFHLDDLHCTGDEESLFQCPHNGLGIHDCGQHDVASVLCYIGK